MGCCRQLPGGIARLQRQQSRRNQRDDNGAGGHPTGVLRERGLHQSHAPYLTWATAATNIQSAVDAALFPGSLVLVTNGVYGPSVIDQPQVVQSVNGPSVTVINGGNAARCASLVDGAVLSGFTLTNGTSGVAGGAYCATANAALFNCVLVGNSATGNGGAAYGGTLNNCILSNNFAGYAGGGARAATLNNCVLSGNNASRVGGGADSSTLNSCLLSGQLRSVLAAERATAP